MALTSNQYSVTSTPALVALDSPSGVRVTLHNTDQGTPVYVNGSSSVSTVTGFRMDAKDKLQLTLNAGEQVWAVCASGQSAVLAVLRQTQYA
jgi:hypothetical protein